MNGRKKKTIQTEFKIIRTKLEYFSYAPLNFAINCFFQLIFFIYSHQRDADTLDTRWSDQIEFQKPSLRSTWG